MKRHVIALYLLLISLFISHVQIAKALKKTYAWNTPAESGYNTYQVSLITSDFWHVDTSLDITFRLTLTSKQHVLNHTETNWVKITLKSEKFIMDSGNQEEKVTLRNIGDYWERKVSFSIPAEKLNRGQTLDVSITFLVSIDEIDNIQWKSWEHTGQNYDDPLTASLYRPFLSTSEWDTIAIVAAVGTICGIAGFIFYKKRKASVKTTSSMQ